MITARCPSCGAPITFAHAALSSTICEQCRSAVQRDGPELRALGRVSSMARDLSPIQLGARGEFAGAGFEVVGVLRKARERVRWNEWFLVFDDGDTGWLGEGNGELSLFKGAALEWPSAPPKLGEQVEIAGTIWRATEVATARVVAADGSLPEPAIQSQAFAYADLRTLDGRAFGTVDRGEDPPRFYVGRPIKLSALSMRGLRHFAGWSDPVMVNFQGPEISAVRALKCDHCGAPVTLRAPGDTVSVACGFCDSVLAVDDRGEDTGLSVISRGGARRDAPGWTPAVALGSRGRLEGVEWEVIGAMRRSVRVDGVDYSWVEHMLHNPYRGYVWLVRDSGSGQWNFIRRIHEVPAGARLGSWDPVVWRDDLYKHFQSGRARVDKVLGEFTWEIRAGDAAETVDYVHPPNLLSLERSGDEEVWTHGKWLDARVVQRAFGLPDLPAMGIAPNQPNPYEDMGDAVARRTLALLGAVLALWLLQSALWRPVALLETSFVSTPEGIDLWVTDAFEVGERGPLRVELDSAVHRRDGLVHVALINLDAPEVYLLPLADTSANKGKAWVRAPAPGQTVARIEVAKAPGKEAGTIDKYTRVTVHQGTPWRTPLALAALFVLLGPAFWAWSRGRFEHRRWQESDHAV